MIKIFKFLQQHHVIKEISNSTYDFHDEPKAFSFDLLLNNNIDYLDNEKGYICGLKDVTASGLSFFSQELAFIKCLNEGIERVCLYTFQKDRIKTSTFNLLQHSGLDPRLFNQNISLDNDKFGWMKGYCIDVNLTNKSIMLPAQLIYLSYLNQEHLAEQFLSTAISTGAAASLNSEESLIRGIYEVIERDAIMAAYLCEIPLPKINLFFCSNEKIQHLLNVCKKYQLEIHTFYITSNIQVPVYLTILHDSTKTIPTISIGMKASLHNEDGVIASVEEALMMRFYERKVIMNQLLYPKVSSLRIKDLITFENRALYWSQKEIVDTLYLLNKKNIIIPFKETINVSNISRSDELKSLISLLNQVDYKVYYADITLPFLRQHQYFIYKVLIPGLQPLYINEIKKELNLRRLKEFSKFHNHNYSEVNSIPHPYL